MRSGRAAGVLALVLMWAGCAPGGGDAAVDADPASETGTVGSSSATTSSGEVLEVETTIDDPVMPAPVPVVDSGNVVQADLPNAEPEPVPDVDLEGFRAAVEQNPDDYAAQRALAIGLFRANRRDQAVAEFERAAELNSGVQAQIDLANAYGFASRLEDSEKTYLRVLQMAPDHAVACYNLANVQFLRGNIEGALANYDRAVTIEPDYMLAWYNRGFALKMLDRFREAYGSFGQVMNLEPSEQEELKAYDNSLYEMAALDIAMGAHERAEQMLQALLEANPNHNNAHFVYGQLLLRQGRVEEAQAHLETHMEIQAKIKPTGPVATAR